MSWSVNNKAGSSDRGGPAGIDLGLAWFVPVLLVLLVRFSLSHSLTLLSCFSGFSVHCSFLVSVVRPPCCVSPCLSVPCCASAMHYPPTIHSPLSPAPCSFSGRKGVKFTTLALAFFFFRDLPIGVVRDEPKHLETLGTPD